MALLDILSGIGPAAGAIGQIFGAFGDSGAEEAAQISREGLEWQKELFAKLWELATATRTDARGDVSGYDPSRGFYTDLSPSSQNLITAQDVENYLRLTEDARLRREGLNANALRRVMEGQAADEALAELRFGPRYSRDSLTGDLVEAATRAVNRGYDDAANNIMRTGLRTGDSTSSGAALARIAERRSDSLADAILNARIAGPQLYEQLESARVGRGLSNYNTLASRAANFEDVAFQPSGIDVGLANTQASMPGAAIGAGQSGMYGVNFGNVANAAGANQGFNPDAFSFGTGELGQVLNGLFSSKAPTYVPSDRGLGNEWNNPSRPGALY